MTDTHNLLILADAYSAVRLPQIAVSLNGRDVEFTTEIIARFQHHYQVKYEAWNLPLQRYNTLEIHQSDKTDIDNIDPHTGGFVDHHIAVRQIILDGIEADLMMLTNTEFRHSMSESWVAGMAQRGIEILQVYRPGSELHLNGTMTFCFNQPFWLDKTRLLESIK